MLSSEFSPENNDETIHDEKPRLEHVSMKELMLKVYEAAEEDGGKIKGSVNDYTPERLVEKMTDIFNLGCEVASDAPVVQGITRAHDLREKFIEVLEYHNKLINELKKEDPDIFSQCKSIEEVKEVIFILGKPIEAADHQYDYEELDERIDAVNNGTYPLTYLTRTAGLRAAVTRIKAASQPN